MKVDRILGTNPLPAMANIFIENMVENIPDGGGNLKIENPIEYPLHRVYPNPFNPVLTMDFRLDKSGFTLVEVYDLKGTMVDAIYSGVLQKGSHQFNWDAEKHPSGTYFVSLLSGDSKVSTSVVLLK